MKVKLVILIAAIVAVVVLLFFLPVVSWLLRLFEFIGSLGPWGPVALSLFNVVACVFLLPVSIPTLAAGFLFGVFVGSLTAILGSTAGACVAFGIGKTAARRWVARRVARSPRFTALDEAVGEQGFKVVFLSRLSPISPFIALNYLFGLTKVSFWGYALGTMIGAAPGTIMFVYFGAGLRSLTEVAAYARGESQFTTTHRVFFWVGLIVTVVVTVLLTLMARSALRKAVPQPATEDKS